MEISIKQPSCDISSRWGFKSFALATDWGPNTERRVLHLVRRSRGIKEAGVAVGSRTSEAPSQWGGGGGRRGTDKELKTMEGGGVRWEATGALRGCCHPAVIPVPGRGCVRLNTLANAQVGKMSRGVLK